MQALLDRYKGFHQLMLAADGDAIAFYESMGFSRAGKTVPMWDMRAMSIEVTRVA
jgi:hypothetical protein